MLNNSRMVDFFRLENVKSNEKVKSIEYVWLFKEMNLKARKEGLLSLEFELPRDSLFDFKELMVLLSGIDSRAIDDLVILKLIFTPNDQEYRFTLFILWLGTRLLQKTVAPVLMTMYFGNAFGDDRYMLEPETFNTDIWSSIINKTMRKLVSKPSFLD